MVYYWNFEVVMMSAEHFKISANNYNVTGKDV